MIVLSLGLMSFTPEVFADGRVIALSGVVNIMENDQAAEKPLKYNDKVTPGQTIVTKADGKLKVLFEEDNSVITVGPASKLKITVQLFDAKQKKRQTFIKIFQGKLRVLVTKMKEMLDSKFEVETSNGIAGVRGTYFFIQDNGTQTQLVTFEGNVALQQGDNVVEVPANFSLTANGGAISPDALQPVTPEQLQTINQEAGVEEEPPVGNVNLGPNVGDAPPPWFEPPSDLGLGNSGNQPGGTFYEQFFGNDPGFGGLELPPIQQEPTTGGAAGQTPVNINISGIPTAPSN